MKKFFYSLVFLLSLATTAQENRYSESTRTAEQERMFDEGLNKLKKKEYKQAVKVLTELASTPNSGVSVYFYIAQAYYENKQYKECVAACTKGLEMGPNENILNYYRAQANVALGNTSVVCEDFKKSGTTEQELLKKYCH